MKKRYTKKQICEAISYWERQLAKGNYRKVNESEDQLSDEEIKDKIERVMEKASDEFDSSVQDEFDKWQKEAAGEVEDLIREGGFSFDELVDVAVSTIKELQQDYEDDEADYAKGPDEPQDYEG